MLNMIETNKKIHFEYTKEIGQVLMNALSFSVALQTKDYSTFSPEVLEQMEKDPEWLYDITNWLQVTIVNSLLQSDNYDSVDEVVSEFNCLLNLYDVARSREFTQNENNLFLSIHDKFLALLLSDDELVNNLLEVE
ncbi:DUF3206 domain-containing protein [Enterococcus faecium]|uniref:DUF3206 domain-containing protein n=1 Tax=Enterococcus faecium TaxID=1352 RepID=UPI0020741FDE|nr:DUF3206 domain-containing protein [Enterococcus faecium]MCM6869531.1 DUF3206 domain-containing protein [Enterococcus faecium]MCM6874871.1 DUF3206 domain-containing protein [Enterococcus faecium]MCM6889488.1 DUF3206 domain-containing protein [Enterococcus faecium]MCM6890906.1 DUF3206 domain-containing protein [Enterococcus faecium]MCM6910310.1 DUF3206 domain-containing protein [Enterococcus faecium]